MNVVPKEKHTQSYHLSDIMKFLVPSLIGVFLFMVPVPYKGEMTIPVAILAKWVEGNFSSVIPTISVLFMFIATVGTIVAKIAYPSFIMNSSFLRRLFDVNGLFVVARIVGTILGAMTLWKIGPEWVWSENTGSLLLYSLIPILFSVFLFAGLFLPLLLDFGLLELCGALLTKVMRPVFKLPGRSSIDCIASWLGDGTIGVLLTNKQYEDGFYTKREAAVIGTTFSVVSITFSIVVITYMKLEHMFGAYYFTIVVAGLVAAIIMPRIPPLSKKPDTYYHEHHAPVDETVPAGYTPFQWGLKQATEVAQRNSDMGKLLKNGVQTVIDMWLGVLPVVMAIGTVALIIAETTSVFEWLGKPFVPILTLLQVPEASAAAQTMVVGFADMFLPAIIGSGIESEFTRFVIACVSVTQLIYMSEVGGLLLASKLPITFKDLVVIFLLRTLITLPIIVFIAHLIF
ncbi:nucleoside recognition membrane protein YjiH [Anoxybacillus mongoliensis]|uniref:Nucleoside recognition membrane protein YjiH n=1 Tax=Anoxybacillus mongoliensis TaxID=452565 RepID=A0A7W8N6A5_9BACL|nr:YjiH family protein [Anoxybacillus mongoliensis]MBB5355334.1 nucleoside recognition membrane protein YjiH [Anoxybacillus mongoliensis]